MKSNLVSSKMSSILMIPQFIIILILKSFVIKMIKSQMFNNISFQIYIITFWIIKIKMIGLFFNHLCKELILETLTITLIFATGFLGVERVINKKFDNLANRVLWFFRKSCSIFFQKHNKSQILRQRHFIILSIR